MTDFENYLHEYFDISPGDCKIIFECFKSDTIKKGVYFSQVGTPSNKLCFIREGMLRIFVKQPEREVTQWIGTRGMFVSDFEAFFYQKSAARDIQAIVDTELLTIEYQQYHTLRQTVPSWKDFEKLFMSKCYIFMERRVFDLISLSAEERYSSLYEQNRELFNKVPQQYLASMLGMTPETFSRIRKKLSS